MVTFVKGLLYKNTHWIVYNEDTQYLEFALTHTRKEKQLGQELMRQSWNQGGKMSITIVASRRCGIFPFH